MNDAIKLGDGIKSIIEQAAKNRAGQNNLPAAHENDGHKRITFWDEYGDEKVVVLPTLKEMQEHFAAATGVPFEMQSEEFKLVFRAMYRFFSGEMGKTAAKGFYLFGGTGTGKTTLFRVFAEYMPTPLANLTVINCIDLAQRYEIEGSEVLKEFITGHLVLDDAASEQTARHFGAVKEVVSELYQLRYDRRQQQERMIITQKELLQNIHYTPEMDTFRRAGCPDDEEGKKKWMAIYDIYNRKMNIIADVGKMKQRLAVTHFTSNLSKDELFQHYNESRFTSRAAQYLTELDLSNERDHRYDKKYKQLPQEVDTRKAQTLRCFDISSEESVFSV